MYISIDKYRMNEEGWEDEMGMKRKEGMGEYK